MLLLILVCRFLKKSGFSLLTMKLVSKGIIRTTIKIKLPDLKLNKLDAINEFVALVADQPKTITSLESKWFDMTRAIVVNELKASHYSI